MVSSSVLFCYAVLFCDSVAVLLCAVRCCSVLFCSVLSCAGWFCAVIFFAAVRCYVCLGSVPSCALLFRPVLCSALLFYAAMCSCVLCCSCSCLSLYSDLVLRCSLFVCWVLVLSVKLDVGQFCSVLLYNAMWRFVFCCYDMYCDVLFCCVLSCSVLFFVLLCFSATCCQGKTHYVAANAISRRNRHVGPGQG